MPRIRIELDEVATDGPMLCRYGCPLPVYPFFGCCYKCLTKEEPKSVPWVKCTRCRRAVDVLLGSAATDEDRKCVMCRNENAIEVLKDGKTFGFASNEREIKGLIHRAGKSIFRIGADAIENRSDSLRLRGTWKALRAIGAFVSDEVTPSGYAKTFVHLEMQVKSKNGKVRGEYECDVECDLTDSPTKVLLGSAATDEDRLCEDCRKQEKRK